MAGRSEDVKTPLARLSYTGDLFKARERGTTNKKLGYGVTLIFPKGTDLTVLHNAALAAAEEAWPGKAKQWLKDGIIKSPFLDGDGKQGKDHEGNPKPGLPGTWFIRATSGPDHKPRVFDRKRNPVMDVSGAPSGWYGYAVVNAYTWDTPENGKGITFGVSMVQVAKEGESLGGSGGSGNPDDFFEEIPDEGSAPAETKAGEGAGGLFG